MKWLWPFTPPPDGAVPKHFVKESLGRWSSCADLASSLSTAVPPPARVAGFSSIRTTKLKNNYIQKNVRFLLFVTGRQVS